MAIKTSWAPGDVLGAADLTDTLASKPTYTYGTATPGSPAAGQIWMDTTAGTANPVAKVYTGSAFVPFSSARGAAVASTTGASGTATYADGGFTYDVYTFATAGTATITFASSGIATALVVGGGGTGGNYPGGGGGQVLEADVAVAAQAYTLITGAAAARSSGLGLRATYGEAGTLVDTGNAGTGGRSGQNYAGGSSWQESANYGGGGGGGDSAVGASTAARAGGNGGAGTSSSITGSAVGYGGGGGGWAVSTTAGTATDGGGAGNVAGTDGRGGGGGGNTKAGGSGVVIVRVRRG